ncbi:MAG: hypothetical protein JRG91_05465 [Deltaproteobacteria bacterium]|nr:hypothetical protein [Deltaproteobacteria bacterium]
MSRRNHIILFWSIIAVGLVVHVACWLTKTGMHYPDEIFQYVEPAYIRLEGYGWLPWEFSRGVRNWTLIAFYGGWMKIFLLLGAEGAWLHRLIGLHNTVLALAIVPAALRMGRLYGGEIAGWTAAAVCAVLPPVLFYSPHPLSEVPAMVLTTWGLTLWLEGRGDPAREGRLAFIAALLLGLSVVIRFFSAAFLIVPTIDYAFRLFQRNRAFLYYAAGGLVSIAVLAFSDWVTWGTPLHSAIEYFRYNLLEWGNAHHGVSPWWQYLDWMVERIGWGLVLFLPLILLGLWRTRLVSAIWIIAIVGLSAIAHKEERFMLSCWPLMVVTFSAGIARLGEVLTTAGRRRALVAAVAGAALVASTAWGVSKLDWHWYGPLFEAQQYVGRQPDATGCMFSGRIHLSGGSAWINRNVPMDSYQADLGRNPLFNYFIVKDGTHEATRARLRRWVEQARFEDYVVYRRE